SGPMLFGKKLYTTSERWQRNSLLLLAAFDVLSLISTKRYHKLFFKSTLATRYQVKEVIGLTRILIPICVSSLFFKFTVIILAYIAFGDIQILDLLFTIIRFCCTATAIVEPMLLLSRHRLLQKQLRLLFGMLQLCYVLEPQPPNSKTIADVYFDAFNKELNKTRSR
ncbi:hypothetical protein PENTCL1PPCAC_15985, partial [Pristionchus entomophagus]